MRKIGSLTGAPKSAFILTALWAIVISFSAWFALASPRYAHVDFIPFYCAGEAIVRGADPYREVPLNGCEHAIASGGLYAAGVTVPAPLPPYALAAYAVLSGLPFDLAYLAFTVLSIAALTLGCRLLGRLTGATFTLIVAAVTSTALDNVRKGQPVPMIFLAIVAAGWALAHGRDRLGALLAAGTMIEPHVGITVCAALLLWRPKTRVTLLGAGAAFAALSLALVPLHVVLSYATDVLPLHAASEAAWITQLSLVSPLVLLGVPVGTALEIALIQYVAFASAGVYFAGRVAKNAGAAEALVFVPPLFAMLGGPFIHGNLMLLAIPGALFLVRRNGSIAGFIGLAVVAISWLSVSEPVQFVIAIMAAGTIAFAYRPTPLVALIAAAVVGVVGFIHGSVAGAPRRAPVFMSVEPTAYAEHSWSEFIRAVNPPLQAQAVALIMKLPTWAGLLFLSRLSGCAARNPTAPNIRVATVDGHERA